MKKFAPYIPFLIILSTAVLLFVKVNRDEQHAADGLIDKTQMIGKTTPDAKLDVILPNKGVLTPADLKGKFNVINLFASWCTACEYEHKFIKEFKGKNKVNIVGIAWRDTKEDAMGWLNKNGNPYDKVALDKEGKYGILMGVTGIPETFVTDAEGKIIMHVKGPLNEELLEEIRQKTK